MFLRTWKAEGGDSFLETGSVSWVYVGVAVLALLISVCKWGKKDINMDRLRQTYKGRLTYDIMADETYNRLLTLFDAVFTSYEN